MRRPDETHRARLRVEIGRLRALARDLAEVEATPRGFRLRPKQAREVVVLAPPIDGESFSCATDGARRKDDVMSTTTLHRPPQAEARPAEIVRELGPFPGVAQVHGVSYDGERVWAATGAQLVAIDPRSGAVTRTLARPCGAGTAFDGRHLWQIAESRIGKIDPATGAVLASIPASGEGCDSGLTWAEGSLWVGHYQGRRIHQTDPETGAIRRTIESNRFVTGVTWVDGELWHGTWEADESELRQVDPRDGQVLQRLQMPPDVGVSGLESDGADLFYCGGGRSGKVRAVRRPAPVQTGGGAPIAADRSDR